jgi:3-isopropylmalate/(R)-2-methylmalate dehydratase small subunit
VGEALLRAVEADPSLEITIDVERRTLAAPAAGIECEFPLDDATRERFLEGLDDIGITLRDAGAIDSFEATRPQWLPSAAAPA